MTKRTPHNIIVLLSLLTMTNLIKSIKCYCLCVLRWLMRPILALNCLLQTEQEGSKERSSVGDALAPLSAEHVSARLC